MKPAKFYHRWSRRLASLLQEIEELVTKCRRTGEVEDIHELRVAMRRSRVYARVGSTALGKEALAELSSWSQQLSVTLGEVRDHDIAIAWLKHKKEVAPALLKLCRDKRDYLMGLALPKLTPLPNSVAFASRQADIVKGCERRVHKKYLKVIEQLETSLHEQIGQLHRLPTDAQHAFRRSVRRYRYLHELNLPRHKHKAHPLITSLTQFQKALGEMQDRVVAERVLRSMIPDTEGKSLYVRLQKERSQWLAKARRAAVVVARKAKSSES